VTFVAAGQLQRAVENRRHATFFCKKKKNQAAAATAHPSLHPSTARARAPRRSGDEDPRCRARCGEEAAAMIRCTRGRRGVQFWRRAANFFSRSPLQQLSPFFPNSGHLRFATYAELSRQCRLCSPRRFLSAWSSRSRLW